jgi:hypothetical protein
VDLAGSENAYQTQTQGQTLREGSNINKSLLSLGIVIQTLSQQTNAFVSYRASNLTWILKENLQGNSQTAIVVAINPSDKFSL